MQSTEMDFKIPRKSYLLIQVQKLLAERNTEKKTIAAQIGMSHIWLRKIAAGMINNPDIVPLENLYILLMVDKNGTVPDSLPLFSNEKIKKLSSQK